MARLALPSRLRGPLLSLQIPPLLAGTISSSPVPQRGALGTQRPTPVTSTHPGLLRPGFFSAQPFPWECLLLSYPPHFPHAFHTQLKCQPLGEAFWIFAGTDSSLLWGVICLTDSPIPETLPLRQGPCRLPDLCLIQTKCPHRTLEGRGEPGPWLPRGCPLALEWPLPTEELWGAACPRGPVGHRAPSRQQASLFSWRGHTKPSCSVIQGWGESGDYSLAVCSPASPLSLGPKAGRWPPAFDFFLNWDLSDI